MCNRCPYLRTLKDHAPEGSGQAVACEGILPHAQQRAAGRVRFAEQQIHKGVQGHRQRRAVFFSRPQRVLQYACSHAVFAERGGHDLRRGVLRHRHGDVRPGVLLPQKEVQRFAEVLFRGAVAEEQQPRL